jgi:carbon storage regulator
LKVGSASNPSSRGTEWPDYMPNSPGFHQGFTRARYKARVRFQNPTLTAAEKTMLVLTRKLGESIHIGADVVLTVLDVRPSRIRLGIAAPLSVRIQRAENLDSPETPTGAEFLTCQSCEDSMKIASFGDLGLKAIRPAAF